MIGKIISHYKILEKLGEGGMGVVYKAEDTELKRLAALKFIQAELTNNPDARERFIFEAQNASALDHANICTIYEIGQTKNGLTFISMAYYVGQTLQEKILQGPLELEEGINIAAQIGAGLIKAHSEEIVHRDINPSNILITEDGQAKILDFGLSKLYGEIDSKTGTTLATLDYMSPEQIQRKRVDHRTDIWSLGVLLYEMLVGQEPFKGEFDQIVIYSILQDEPKSITSLRQDLPTSLDRIVNKALVKNPDERYQHVKELVDDLNELHDSRKSSAHDVQWKLGRRLHSKLLWLIIACSLLVAAFWYILQVQMQSQDTPLASAPIAIAVLPFSIQGSDEIGYLREGMVDLLSTKLNGAGELRSVDPRSLLSYITRNGSGQIDPERGGSIADHFGARSFILGNIVEANGRLQISASFYDVANELQPATQTVAVGEVTQIFALVDKLATQLLINLHNEMDLGFKQTATLTTQSFPAVKAYLQGESAYRRARYNDASDAFRRAVVEDSSFALAWYRLAMVIRVPATGWDRALKVVEKALRHSERVSIHDRLNFEAFHAFLRADSEEAERLYKMIVGTYPNDFEAWHKLGAIRKQYNWRRGRSVSEARNPLERALALEPEERQSLNHLASVAAYERNYEEFRILADRRYPEGDVWIQFRAVLAFGHSDQATQEQIIAELGLANNFNLVGSAMAVANYTDDPVGAQRIARLLTESTRSQEVRGLGHVILAYLEATRGRWKAAKVEFNAAEPLNPAIAIEYRAFLAAVPFLPVPETDLEAIRDVLVRWDAAAVPPSETRLQFLRIHDKLHPYLRIYLLGLLSMRLGDLNSALDYAAQMEQMNEAVSESRLVEDLAHGLRAQVAWKQGRPKEALSEFEQAQMKNRVDKIVWTSFYKQSLERFLRAELLYEMNRNEEAIGWYSSFGQSWGYEYIYFAPSHLRRGQIYERMGQREKAIDHYARFIELWRDCDAELRPKTEKAKTRLEHLLQEKN
jgi:serine/threonine protein kinase/Flp pilus assembly protein TadD